MSKLYRVTFIRQDTGEEQEQYVLAKSMVEVEQVYADIVKVEPLMVEKL